MEIVGVTEVVGVDGGMKIPPYISSLLVVVLDTAENSPVPILFIAAMAK